MTLEQLTSAIYNNIVAGLKSSNVNVSFTHEHIEDSIISERLLIIKEYMLKGMLPRKDLLVSIPCIELNCYPINKCPSKIAGVCNLSGDIDGYYLHYEIPQLIHDFGEGAIEYIGSTDRMNPFKVYLDRGFVYNKYRTRRNNKAFTWIDNTPNLNNKYDGYVFNTPVLKEITAVIIPKDPRHLRDLSCCNNDEIDSFSFFSADIEKRLSEKFIRYYRQLTYPLNPADLTIKP
jgi:hypothetical protein